MEEFVGFPKMPRLSRDVIVTEKIDGTNAQIYFTDAGEMHVGSRTRWITPKDDNYGFAKWAEANRADLEKLGPGRHFGEWWGQGIQRTYGLTEKRFSLFNVVRWADPEVRPTCCYVVPTLYIGAFDTKSINNTLYSLIDEGSSAAPGFMKPEGIIVFHTAGLFGMKKTIDNDGLPKSLVKEG